MQVVISVNINARPQKNGNEAMAFAEYEFPEVNKYLQLGFKVVQFYQIAPSPSLYCSTLTFVLEKVEKRSGAISIPQ